MSRPTILKLSISQALGLAISAIGGSAVWFMAAAFSRSADLGVLGRAISTSTLIASIVTAGLGQFLLAIVRSSSTNQIQRYLRQGTVVGALVSAFISLTIGIFQDGGMSATAVAMGFFGAGIAITNLQDSVYLGTSFVKDVPAKGMAIIATRLVLLLSISSFQMNLLVLLAIFAVSQFGIGLVWTIVRIPRALKNHIPESPNPPHRSNIRYTLVLSYLYSIATTCIVMGTPALVTSLETPEQAGKFYIAWTMAGLLAGASVAVANSVLAISLKSNNKAQSLLRILGGLCVLLSIGGIVIIFVIPRLLALFNHQYLDIPALLTALIVGQIFFGIAIVALAAYRVLASGHSLISLLMAWPLIIVGSVTIGTANDGTTGASVGFAASNIVAAIMICAVAFRATLAERQIAVKQASEGAI